MSYGYNKHVLQWATNDDNLTSFLTRKKQQNGTDFIKVRLSLLTSQGFGAHVERGHPVGWKP